MFVNRGIYHQGWTTVTRHSTPWVMVPLPAIDDDVWELYGPDDWTQAHNIADDNPAKLAELQRLFLIEATKYNVLPLDDRRIERFNADLAGRPQLIKGNTQLLFGGMGRLSRELGPDHQEQVTRHHREPHRARHGRRRRDHLPGWRVRRMEPLRQGGTPKYCYNLLGLQRSIIEGDRALPPGDHQVRVEFDYDGGGLAKGATITLFIDGDQVGNGHLDATVPMVFSADETTDVGHDTGTGVSDEYRPGDNEFTGTVHWVQIDIDDKAEDFDHLITPEERWQIAMARQ